VCVSTETLGNSAELQMVTLGTAWMKKQKISDVMRNLMSDVLQGALGTSFDPGSWIGCPVVSCKHQK
jgi:hypothetical protein